MWLLALSIWGALGEIIFRSTVRRRDYFLYGIMFVITYEYSQNGDSVATIHDLAISGAIQTFFELMTDFLSTLALAAFLQIDFFALVRNRRWCWCLPGSMCIFLMSAYSNNAMMTQILCHYHGDFESRFSLCTH